MRGREEKTIIAVGDGMADEPLEELGGKTPLEAARTPCMDALARLGRLGLVRTVPEGMPPGSDVANLSLMGYAPRDTYTGRAPLEAASLGIRMESGDLAFRCNLVTLAQRSGERVMADYSGGGITTPQACLLVDALNRHLAGPDLRFYPGIAYRHLLILRGAGDRFLGLQTTPPHDITGQPVLAHLPAGQGAERVIRLAREAEGVFAGLFASRPGEAQGRANAIWLWGQGRAPRLPSLQARTGVRGATVCAVDLIKGIGRYAEMTSIEVPGATGDLDTDYRGKAGAALRGLADHDLVFVHVEAPDEAGHQGNLREKIRAIERFDEEVVGAIWRGLESGGRPYRILVLPDHPTPLRLRTHTGQPVPFLLYAKPDRLPGAHLLQPSRAVVEGYSEREAAKTGIFIEEGHRLFEVLFARRSGGSGFG